MTSDHDPAATVNRLRITEIFLSLQGESDSVGWPTVFVRLTGCPLRCSWCDTTYSFHGGDWWNVDAIVIEVKRHGVRHVCVTGGEPLAQKRCLDLLGRLCDEGLIVSMETSGAIDLDGVDPRVHIVMDIKAPGSGEVKRNRWDNLQRIAPSDQIKFVLADRFDYDWAVSQLWQHGLHEKAMVLFSPVHATLPPRELADWIVADRLPVRFQMQLHKQLWGEEAGR